MPTTTIRATAAMYGNSNRNAYTESAGTHIYIGYTGGTRFNYRSYLKFPSLKSIAAIGNNSIVITAIRLYCYRNDQGNTYIYAAPNTSASWANRSSMGSAYWSSSKGWKSLSLNETARNAIRDYTGAWYMHLWGAQNYGYIRCYSPGNSSYAPYIEVDWEFAEKTITFTDSNDEPIGSVICDGENEVNINIDSTRYESEASYTLSYSIGDQSGVIVNKAPKQEEVTTCVWDSTTGLTMDLLSEIANANSGDATISLTSYTSSNAVYRTEKAVITLVVPDDIKPGIPMQAVGVNNSYSTYGLTGLSTVTILPLIDGEDLYGAKISQMEATITQPNNTVETLIWNETEIENEILGIEWTPGHYTSNGEFKTPDTWASEQNTYKPVTSNMLPVVQGIPFHLEVTYGSSHSSVWAGVARFDASGAFIARTAIQGSAQLDSIDVTYTPVVGDAFVSVIFRGFNDYEVKLSYDDMVCGMAKTSSVLTQAGTVTVTVDAVDSRGRDADTEQEPAQDPEDRDYYVPTTISVLSYTVPSITSFEIDRIAPLYDVSEQVIGFNEADEGEYAWANITATLHALTSNSDQVLSFSLTVTDLTNNTPVGTRTGTLSYTGDGNLTATVSNELNSVFPTSTLVTVDSFTVAEFNTGKTYEFALTITDKVGVSVTTYSQIVPGRANLHLAGSKYGVAVGRFSKGTDPNVQAAPGPLFECEYPAIFYNGIDVRGGEWTSLALNTIGGVTEGSNSYRHPGVQYRVENGNHVYVHANIATTSSVTIADATPLKLISGSIDSGLLPSGEVQIHAVGCCNGSKYIIRGMVNKLGEIYIYMVQETSLGSASNTVTFLWTDIQWDWFI